MATASITLLNPPLSAGNTEWIVITWDEMVGLSDFQLSEVSVTGATIASSDWSAASDGEIFYFEITVPSGQGGRVTISFAENVVGEGNEATSADFDWGTGPQNATLTISTSETALHTGKTFNIDITSDIDISDFVLGDVTVTGGTANSLTETDAQNFVLSVTAGSAGTLNVAIAEDVVTPGNAAVDEDFTIVARATVGIVFDDSTLEAGESTTARIVFSGPVTGLTLTDFSVNVGSVTNLQESTSNSYTATVTAPSSGSGTLTLTLRENAVDQGNAVETESLTYTPPADAVLNITVSSANVLTGTSPVVTFAFNKAVSDFTDADVTVSTGAIKGTLADNGDNTFDMPVTAPATGSGTVTVSVASDVVTPGNNADSVTFTYAEPTITLLHIADGDDDNFRVIPTDTADSDDATVYRTYTIPNATDVQSLVFDGTHFHTTNWNSNTVIVFGPNTQDGQSGTVVRTYTVTDISQPSGMAFDGTHLHISDRNDDNIRVIAPDTANGGTATVLRTYEVPGAGDIRGMTFDGTNIHAADYTDDNIRVFAPDTADGDNATVLRTYEVPDANHIRSITFDGTQIHVSDVDDDNFRVIAVPTAGGAQTVLRTYEIPGVNLPRGFAYVLPVTGAPPAPENLTATAEANGTEIDLDWDVPTDSGDSTITDYEVRYAEGTSIPPATTWTSIGSTATEYTVTGLDKGTQYTFQVRAVNSEGGGMAASVTQTTATTVPGVPTSLSVSVTRTTATLSWTAPTDDGGASITEYQYRYQEGDSPGGSWTDTNDTATSFLVPELTANTEYTFQVRAVNSEGNSAGSNAVTETTESLTVPTAPRNLTASANANGTEVDLDWDTPSDNGGASITGYQYRYQEGGSVGGVWTDTGSTTTAFTVTGLDKGTEYTFQVRAVNSEGNSVSNPSVTETTATTLPSAPTNLTATANANGTEIDLDWDAPSDDGGASITGYQYRYQEGGSVGGVWTNTSSTTTAFTVSGLDKGTQYTFQVRTVTSVGQSTANPSVTETTDTTVPSAPTSFAVTAHTTTADLSWVIGSDGGSPLTATQVTSDGGTNWINIAADATSYEFTGLTPDTEYQFAVRHISAVGAGPATATLVRRTHTAVYVPATADLHNTLFLKNIIEAVTVHGTQTVISEMTDNDYNTYSDETDIDISLGAAAEVIHFIFIKYKGDLTSYVATPSGGRGSAISRTVPATVTDVLGNSVSLEVSGFKHDLLPVSAIPTGTALRVEFTGSDIEVYDLKVLQVLFDTNANRDWTRFTPAKVDTQGSLRENKGGGFRRSPSLGNLRWLWQYDVELLCTKLTEIDTREILAFMKNTPQCVMSRAFTEHPAQVLPVTFSNVRVDTNRRGQSKQFGETLAFTIKERGRF